MRPTKSSLVVVAILVSMVLGATFFVYLPQARAADELETRHAKRRLALKEKSTEASIVPALFREVSTMRSRYRNFDRRLPGGQELGNFLREITGYLATARIPNQILEPGRPTKEDLFHTLPIIMRFKGPYLALGGFLERIDKMERLTRVQKLTIKAPAPERNRGKQGPDGAKEQLDAQVPRVLDIELQLNIYFSESNGRS